MIRKCNISPKNLPPSDEASIASIPSPPGAQRKVNGTDVKLLDGHVVFDAGVGNQVAWERTTGLELNKQSVSKVLLVDLEVVLPVCQVYGWQ